MFYQVGLRFVHFPHIIIENLFLVKTTFIQFFMSTFTGTFLHIFGSTICIVKLPCHDTEIPDLSYLLFTLWSFIILQYTEGNVKVKPSLGHDEYIKESILVGFLNILTLFFLYFTICLFSVQFNLCCISKSCKCYTMFLSSLYRWRLE